MGKINEYQRKQLASQAVGSAEPSRAGQIIGQAVGQFGQTLKKRELQKREESINLQANLGLMEFAPALQKESYHLQREMADNPQGFQERLFEDGVVLIDEFSKGISNSDVRQKFVQHAQTLLQHQVLSASSWVEAKDRENAQIAADAAVRKGVIAFGQTQTVDGLKEEIEGFRTFVREEIPDDITEHIGADEILRESMPEALESHFSNRVFSDADALSDDLNAGKYDNVSGFTAAMKTKFLKAAETEKRKEETRIRRAQVDNFELAYMDLTENKLSFTDIDELANAPNPKDRVSSPRRLKTALLNKVEADASELARSTPAAADFIDLVYKVFHKEERINRAEVLEKAVDIWRDGIPTPEEAQFIVEMSRDFKSVQSRKKWLGYTENLGDIKQWADRVYGHEDAALPLARMVREFFRVTFEGADVYTSKAQILRQEAIRRALEFNPMLSTYEDPVEQGYRHQAIQILKDLGEPIDPKNIEYTMEWLKSQDEVKD